MGEHYVYKNEAKKNITERYGRRRACTRYLKCSTTSETKAYVLGLGDEMRDGGVMESGLCVFDFGRHPFAFRCDMDALLSPSEQCEYVSTHRMMHACGHDGHGDGARPRVTAIKKDLPQIYDLSTERGRPRRGYMQDGHPDEKMCRRCSVRTWPFGRKV